MKPKDPLSTVIFGETWLLLQEKALFWPKEALLVISDVHLGKAKHFQSQGISVPGHLGMLDIKRIEDLVVRYKPKSCLFLGDLFHARENSDWQLFKTFIEAFPKTQFILVKGNHDYLDNSSYSQTGLSVCAVLSKGAFRFQHEPEESAPKDFVFSGHVHPGVLLKGTARTRLRLPCFYLKNNQLILPAFGNFTGLYTIDPAPTDRVFAIGAGEVFEVKLKQ